MISSAADFVGALSSGHEPGRRSIVGIVGPPGAGKSHLARFVGAALASSTLGAAQVAVVPMDGFHLSDDVLRELGRSDRKGAPDTFDVAGLAALLGRLRSERSAVVYAPRFHREIEESGSIAIGPLVELVIVEGNYLLVDDGMWKSVGDHLDAAYYVETPADVRFRRLLARHRPAKGPAAEAWITAVDEPNAQIVEATRYRADHIVGSFDVPGELQARRATS